jgi:hypothetical protein
MSPQALHSARIFRRCSMSRGRRGLPDGVCLHTGQAADDRIAVSKHTRQNACAQESSNGSSWTSQQMGHV